MGVFLPEGFGSQGASGAPPDPAQGNIETTPEDLALMQRVLAAASKNPNLIPPDFMAYVLDYIQVSRLQIPIGQVFGFSQFTARIAPDVLTQEATSSVTYTDLATVGPTLDGLPDGQYVILFGAAAVSNGAGIGARVSFSLNGGAAQDASSILVEDKQASISRGIIQALHNGSGNMIQLKYRVGNVANIGTFQNRWLLALKYGNL